MCVTGTKTNKATTKIILTYCVSKITVYYIFVMILISTVLCLCCPIFICFLFWLEIKQFE